MNKKLFFTEFKSLKMYTTAEPLSTNYVTVKYCNVCQCASAQRVRLARLKNLPDEKASPLSCQGTHIHGLVYWWILLHQPDVHPAKSSSPSHCPALVNLSVTCFAPCCVLYCSSTCPNASTSSVMFFINQWTFDAFYPPDSSSISLRPAVNVEDVDSDHEIGGRGRGGEGQSNVPQILTPQDPKLTTLTVPVTPSGGRQR